MRRDKYITSIQGDSKLNSHKELLNKEINGIIDHADNSIPDSKIISVSWSKVDKTGSSINDLDDVNITNAQTDQVLSWNGTKWVNRTLNWVSGTNHYVNVKDYGAIGNGNADDTNAVIDAVNALPASGGIVYFPPGKYKISNVEINKNNVLFVGEGGYHSDSGSDVTATLLIQGSASNPIIKLVRTSSGTGHINGFGLINLGIKQASNATKPLLDTSDFAKKISDGTLQTPAVKGFILEKLTVWCNSNQTELFSIYNPDINPIIRDIRANGVKHRLFAFHASNHNSGNIYVENITIGIDPQENARLVYMDTDNGNMSYNTFKHLRTYGGTGDTITNNYMIELYADGNDIRWNSFQMLRTEEAPLLWAHTNGTGKVTENWFRDIIYRDRRDKGTTQKIGIVLSGNVTNNYFYNGKLFKGSGSTKNIDIGIQDNGNNNRIYYSNFIFENVNIHIQSSSTNNYVTNKAISTTVSVDSTGLKTINIPHGLSYVPVLNNITLTMKASDDVKFSNLRLVSVDNTNIVVKVIIEQTGTSGEITAFIR